MKNKQIKIALLLIFLITISCEKDNNKSDIDFLQNKCWQTTIKSEWIYINDSLVYNNSRDYGYEAFRFNAEKEEYIRYEDDTSNNLIFINDFGKYNYIGNKMIQIQSDEYFFGDTDTISFNILSDNKINISFFSTFLWRLDTIRFDSIVFELVDISCNDYILNYKIPAK